VKTKCFIVTLFLICLYSYFFLFSSQIFAQETKNSESKDSKKSTTKVPSKIAKKPPALEDESTTSVPIKIRSCRVGDDLVVSGKVQTKDFSELRSGWMSMIEKINVSVGDKVKKGQMIALVDTGFLKRQVEFYQSYLVLLLNQMKSKESLKRVTSERGSRVKPLADKGIVPQSELEAIYRDVASIESTISQIKRQKETLETTLNDLVKQVKSANFYSPIEGVVTYIIADPKSIVGRVEARGRALVARIDSPGSYLSRTFLTDFQRIKVKEGDIVSISLPDEQVLQGKVSFISPIAVKPEDENKNSDDSLSSYMVDVSFSRPGAILPEGLNAQMTFPSKEPKVQRCIPWNAVQVEDGKPMLKYYDENSGWVVKEVQLGRRGRYNVELLTELPESAFLLSKLY
jgi:multidrug efflux pump subunit AcrA (membrane-fusion protein)